MKIILKWATRNLKIMKNWRKNLTRTKLRICQSVFQVRNNFPRNFNVMECTVVFYHYKLLFISLSLCLHIVTLFFNSLRIYLRSYKGILKAQVFCELYCYLADKHHCLYSNFGIQVCRDIFVARPSMTVWLDVFLMLGLPRDLRDNNFWEGMQTPDVCEPNLFTIRSTNGV